MEPESSSQCSDEPDIGPFPESEETNLLASCFPTKILYALLVPFQSHPPWIETTKHFIITHFSPASRHINIRPINTTLNNKCRPTKLKWRHPSGRWRYFRPLKRVNQTSKTFRMNYHYITASFPIQTKRIYWIFTEYRPHSDTFRSLPQSSQAIYYIAAYINAPHPLPSHLSIKEHPTVRSLCDLQTFETYSLNKRRSKPVVLRPFLTCRVNWDLKSRQTRSQSRRYKPLLVAVRFRA